MVEFISHSGGKMFVHESRVEEYKGRGYKLAPSSSEEKPKKTTNKREK